MPRAWAIIEDGKIDLRTVYESRRGSIVNWLCARKGFMVTVFTSDKTIEEFWNLNRRNETVEEVVIWRGGMTYQHVKTERTYDVLTEAFIEEGKVLAIIYQAREDGTIWVRPKDQFMDGRFKLL